MGLVARINLYHAMLGFISAAIFTWPVMAAETASIPDFSGVWGRNMLLFEPPVSGPGPIINKNSAARWDVGATPALRR